MTRHQKRLSAPKQYPIQRKNGTYIIKAKGPHSHADGVPITVILRGVLGYAETQREVDRLLAEQAVLRDGRPVSSGAVTVGFMDVISLPSIDEHYRVLVQRNGFVLQPIDADDATVKLARVMDKTTVKGGTTQLNLYDGNNIETEEEYAAKSTLLVSLPDLEIEQEFPLAEGNMAYIRGGQHAGVVARITEVNEGAGMSPAHVVLERDDETIETRIGNVYVVGADEPEVVVDAD